MSLPDTTTQNDPCTKALETAKAIPEIIGASAFSSPADKVVVYARIREEIEAHRAIIFQWNLYHNSISNVSRLPTELLAQIFKCVANSYQRGQGDSPIFMIRVPWVHLSHVCSHWRRVALDTVTLWTSINPRRKCATELLSRSKRAPLRLFIDYIGMNESQWKFTESMLSEHMDRMEVLWLDYGYSTASSDGWFRRSAALLGETAAPLLRTFVVNCGTYGSDRDRDHILRLPEILLGIAPCLQEVALHCRAPSWRSFPFKRVTSLNIGINPHSRNGEYWGGTLNEVLENMAMSDLMHLLDNLPNLERLYLGLPILPPVQGQLQHKIHLDRLVDLDIHTTIENCVYLIDHLVCPTTSTTNFCTSSFNFNISLDLEGVRVVAGAVAKWTSVHVVDQLRLARRQRVFSVHLQKAQSPVGNGPVGNGPVGAGYLKIYLLSWLDNEVWTALLAPLRLPQLKVLQIDTVGFNGQDEWLRSLGDLNSLREISSFLDQDESILRTLTGAETTQFMALETLNYRCWDGWSEKREMLKEYLWKRHQLGRPLRVLSFASCRFLDEPKARAEFGGCVETVVWR